MHDGNDQLHRAATIPRGPALDRTWSGSFGQFWRCDGRGQHPGSASPFAHAASVAGPERVAAPPPSDGCPRKSRDVPTVGAAILGWPRGGVASGRLALPYPPSWLVATGGGGSRR